MKRDASDRDGYKRHGYEHDSQVLKIFLSWKEYYYRSINHNI